MAAMSTAVISCCVQAGDHVRVLSGPHAGERGMVVAVNEGMCVLLPDSRQGELRVFAKDLTEAVESGTGVCAFSIYLIDLRHCMVLRICGVTLCTQPYHRKRFLNST